MRSGRWFLAVALALTALGCTPHGAGWPAPPEERLFASPPGSRIFHRPDCVWIRKDDLKSLKWFPAAPAAVQAGRIPCEFCKPLDE